MVVELFTERTERLAPGTVLHTDSGDIEVVASRPHQQRWIVQFAGSETRNDAEAMRGRVLRAEAIDDPDELWVHDLVDAEVRTVDGAVVGRCVAVQANPAADLLELDTGALVPVVFVTERAEGVVVIDPPEGLLDL